MPGGKPWFSTPDQLIRRYDELGIEKACLLPLVNAEVYLPQSNEEILQIAEQHPDRFIPFCNIDPRAITNSADAPLGDLLRYYRDLGCKGIGEVMPNLPFLDPLVQNLFKHVAAVGFPLIFDISHCIGNRYGLYDDPGLPQLERSLQNFPKLIILATARPTGPKSANFACRRIGPAIPITPSTRKARCPACSASTRTCTATSRRQRVITPLPATPPMQSNF